MAELIRRDPRRDAGRLRTELDRLFEDALRAWPLGTREDLYPTVDIYEGDGKYEAHVDLPGIDPEDVEINVTGNQVTVRGEMKEEDEKTEGNVYWKERYSGQFARSFELPVAIESDNVEAVYEDGVLKIDLPKADEERPKSIKVKRGK